MVANDIKNKTIRSIVALTGRTILLQVVSTFSFFILGIYFSPSTFGIYGITLAILRIFTLFTDVGLGAALIQKKDELEENDLKTVFTIQEILVVTTVTIGLLLTPVIKNYGKLDSSGLFLYQVLIFTLFVSSLKVIPSILLERKLHFDKQIIPQIAESLTFNLVVIILAIKGFQVAAFSWGFLASSLVGLPIYYFISPWKPGFRLDIKRAKALFTYGIQYQGKSFLAVIKDDLWVLFLAKLVGAGGIGYWTWAQRWAYGPYRLVVDSVTKVTFPAYSRIQNDQDSLSSGINRTLFSTSIILFPSLAMLATLASGLIQIIPRYSKWEPALVSLYFLCAQAAIASVSNNLINVLDAKGKVRTTLFIMIMWIVLTWGISFILVSKIGTNGIALSQLIVSLSIVLIIYWVRRVVEFDLISNVLTPAIASIFLIITVTIIQDILPKSFLFLTISGICGAISYLMILILLSRDKLITNFKIIYKAYKG